jgi:hypothetical protein
MAEARAAIGGISAALLTVGHKPGGAAPSLEDCPCRRGQACSGA